MARPEADRWRYEDRGYETPCRIWQDATNGGGYGVRRRKGAIVYVHRDAWERACGPITDGLHVLHHCDVPPCGELAHLFLGTPLDNVRDALEKGRMVPPPRLVGEANPRAVLTVADVREIRASLERPTVLARRYGVNTRAISFVRQGRTWKEVA